MMFSQRYRNTVVGDFRPSRKCCFSFYGSLLFLVLLCLSQEASGRPSQEDDLPSDFNVAAQFKDVDNVEIHHVKVVDGVEQEDHPIIMYKEDFVNEDYVPSKNETKSDKAKRRYKDISQRRRQRQHKTEEFIEEKPEKMLFDIIPQKPLIVAEDLEKPRKSHLKLVPLLEDVSEDNESNQISDAKSLLNKRPKKYHHHRVRRDASKDHVVQKRNPYFRHFTQIAELPISIQYVYVKHSVPGKKHNALDIVVTRAPTNTNTNTNTNINSGSNTNNNNNDNMPISFDNRVAADEDDRYVFSGGRTTPRPTRRPTESIFRDPRPENFDFSFMNPQVTPTTRAPAVNRPRPTESIFRDPRPENFDFSFMNPGQETQQSNVIRRPATNAPAPSTPTVTQCVWAIVNCCSNRNSDVRYSCFEENGCYGAFWDINPCADNVRDSVIGFVADYYN